MRFLKRFLRAWLGIDRTDSHLIRVERTATNALSHADRVNREIADAQRTIIDLGARPGDTTIIVASQLGGGRVHVLHDSFQSLTEMERFMDSRFPGWRRPRGRNDCRRIFDTPRGEMFRDFGSGDAFNPRIVK